MSLKQFITRKLEENVPLDDIKKELIGKGYSADQINKAVREAIGNAHKKLSLSTKIQIGAIAIGILIVASIVFYMQYSNGKEITNLQPENASKIVAELCKRYPKDSGKIICENAVSIALSVESGNVQNVSIGTIPWIDFSTSPPSTKNEMNWLVDILLEKSRFDTNFKKEIKILRVGVGLNGDTGIYREPIE